MSCSAAVRPREGLRSARRCTRARAGHFAGLLTGMYLGWGMAPNVPRGGKAPSPGPAAAEGGGGGEAGAAGQPAAGPVAPAAVLEGFRRWTGFAAFAASLGLVVATTVVARTGTLPGFKGPDLFFLGHGPV